MSGEADTTEKPPPAVDIDQLADKIAKSEDREPTPAHLRIDRMTSPSATAWPTGGV